MFVLAPMATKTTSFVSGNGRQAISREDIRIFFSASHRKSYCLPLSFNIRGMSFSISSSLNPSTSHSFPFLNSPLVLLFFYSSIFFLFPFFVLSSPMKNIPLGTLNPIFFFSFWSFLFSFLFLSDFLHPFDNSLLWLLFQITQPHLSWCKICILTTENFTEYMQI